MEIFHLIVLSLSGLLLLFVGATRLSNPVKAFLKNSGIQLPQDTDLLNEMRGLSALMLCGGILVLLGTFLPAMAFASFVVACLVFLGFALGRLLSLALDGQPNRKLLSGLVFELVLGGMNGFCLIWL